MSPSTCAAIATIGMPDSNPTTMIRAMIHGLSHLAYQWLALVSLITLMSLLAMPGLGIELSSQHMFAQARFRYHFRALMTRSLVVLVIALENTTLQFRTGWTPDARRVV